LLLRPNLTYTDGENGDGRDLADGILDGPGDVSEETSGTFSLGLIFGTGGTADGKRDTLGFSSVIKGESASGLFLQHLVVVTIGKDDEDLSGVFSESGGGSGGGQHVSAVYDTGRNGSTRTAADSTGNAASEDLALSLRRTL
jgi:hypothetical protein